MLDETLKQVRCGEMPTRSIEKKTYVYIYINQIMS